MEPRRSFGWPILLGVVLIAALIALTVGWVLVSIAAALGSQNAAFYWAVLGVGVALLVVVLAGVIVYLALTVKAIALSQRQSNFIDSVTHELKSPLVQRHGVADDAITVEAAADGPFVVAGQTADVEIVIRNLLDNAVKYSLPDPRVTVTISRTNAGRVRIAVADNGPGIPIPLRPLIFRRFHRLGSELERSTPGTGLGLFLVKSLVRRMRGKVLVRGRQPPPGTVFEVELPAAPPA